MITAEAYVSLVMSALRVMGRMGSSKVFSFTFLGEG